MAEMHRARNGGVGGWGEGWRASTRASLSLPLQVFTSPPGSALNSVLLGILWELPLEGMVESSSL